MKHISGGLCHIQVAPAYLVLSLATAMAQQKQSLAIIGVKFKKDTRGIVSSDEEDGTTLNTQTLIKPRFLP